MNLTDTLITAVTRGNEDAIKVATSLINRVSVTDLDRNDALLMAKVIKAEISEEVDARCREHSLKMKGGTK